jgi:hypothetical protein
MHIKNATLYSRSVDLAGRKTPFAENILQVKMNGLGLI